MSLFIKFLDTIGISVQNNEPNQVNCSKCNDVEWIDTTSGVRRCECLIRKIKVQNLGEKFADVDLTICKLKNIQVKIVKEIVKNPNLSLFLHGDTNSGKTFIISGLYNLNFKYCDEMLFLTDDQLRNESIETVHDETYEPLISSVRIREGKVKRFYWDGLNDGNRVSISDFMRNEIYTIINELYLAKRQLVITSNYSLDALNKPELLGGQTCRRIQEMCKVIKI